MSEVQKNFEPKILGILCNWCSYAGADLAGISRFQYPANLKIMRVMCSGRVDPLLVVEALITGVDGLLIGGCHLGDCHYQTGNYHARLRIKALMEALSYTGLEPERVRLEWISASEGARFAQVVTEYTEQIRGLGPTPVGTEDRRPRILAELKAVRNLVADHRIRLFVGKEIEIVEKGNVYDETIEEERYEELLGHAIRGEYIRNYILVRTEKNPRSVLELAEELSIEPGKILNNVSVLRRKNLLALDHIDGTTPRYLSLVRGGDEK